MAAFGAIEWDEIKAGGIDVGGIEHSEIVEGLEALGLRGAPVAVHAALSSFGRVRGGAVAVADALVDVCGTVMAPTFCSIGRCGPPVDAPAWMIPAHNGMDVEFQLGLVPPAADAFDPDSFGRESPIDRQMGAIPRALLALAGSVRSPHPSRSWVVVGDGAADFATPHPADAPLAPLEHLCDAAGFVLLLGVTLKRCTAFHLAEQRAGRSAFVRWIRYSDGTVRTVREPGCSEGFDRLAPDVDHLSRRVLIGRCMAIAYPIEPMVKAVAARIERDPEITRCRSEFACVRCEDAIAGGPLPR